MASVTSLLNATHNHGVVAYRRVALYNPALTALMNNFDILFFLGEDPLGISTTISKLQEKKCGPGAGAYSHVGLVIRGDSLRATEQCSKDQVFVFESTASGKIGNSPTNVDGKGFMGVQLRDLDVVGKDLDRSAKTKIMWAPLNAEARARVKVAEDEALASTEGKATLEDIVVARYNYRKYDTIPNLLAGLFSSSKFWRKVADSDMFHRGGIDDKLFCSELVAQVMIDIGVLEPDSVDPREVIPCDFRRNLAEVDKTFDSSEKPCKLFLQCEVPMTWYPEQIRSPTVLDDFTVPGTQHPIVLYHVDPIPKETYNCTFSCKGLCAKDSNGLSDPYLKIYMHNPFMKKTRGRKLLKTAIIKKTLNPKFTEELTITLCPYYNGIIVEVWDHDTGSKDDFMGYTEVVFPTWNPSSASNEKIEVVTNFGPRPNHDKDRGITGTLTVKFDIVPRRLP